MPTLKTRNLFISHAWSYSPHYVTIVKWFDEERNFSWSNCSVAKDDAFPDKTKKGLKSCLTRQIKPSQGIIILAGMWAAHREWIEYEIDEALRLNKTIIGVKPWGRERIPTIVQDATDIIVNWRSSSVIKAVRNHV